MAQRKEMTVCFCVFKFNNPKILIQLETPEIAWLYNVESSDCSISILYMVIIGSYIEVIN